MALGKLTRLAYTLAALTEQDRGFVNEYVKIIETNPGLRAKLTAKKAKRKYTRKAKAVEVAPGVRVSKRKKSDEVDHSPRPVSEQ